MWRQRCKLGKLPGLSNTMSEICWLCIDEVYAWLNVGNVGTWSDVPLAQGSAETTRAWAWLVYGDSEPQLGKLGLELTLEVLGAGQGRGRACVERAQPHARVHHKLWRTRTA